MIEVCATSKSISTIYRGTEKEKTNKIKQMNSTWERSMQYFTSVLSSRSAIFSSFFFYLIFTDLKIDFIIDNYFEAKRETKKTNDRKNIFFYMHLYDEEA